MKNLLFCLLGIIYLSDSFSQSNSVGIGTVNPHPSAALEVRDSMRGFLLK
jgi:hypothetical protein